MADDITLQALSDDALLTRVRRLTARSNVTLADLLAHLGEVESRGIHRLRAAPTLYAYCIYELRMSEDAAYRRSKAARLVREHPELRDRIARGELHLTGLLMIGPYLGGDRHAEILERARFRSKREIAKLIAEIDPKPEVAALVEPIGVAQRGRATHRAFVESLAEPVRELSPGERPEDWIEAAAGPDGSGEEAGPPDLDDAAGAVLGPARDGEPARDVEPARERPLQYKVQFTASQEYVDLLNEAFDLLGHEMRTKDLPEVQLRAMRELVRQLRKRKRAETERPRRSIEPEKTTDAAAPARRSEPDTPARDSDRDAPARNPARDANAAAPARNPEPDAPTGDSDHAAPARSTSRGALERTESRPGSRRIPATVARAVWTRDGDRCAYVDLRGQRCRETRCLELHHRHPHALGGPPTVDNLEIRCTSHNLLAAEQDFGREQMDWARGVA